MVLYTPSVLAEAAARARLLASPSQHTTSMCQQGGVQRRFQQRTGHLIPLALRKLLNFDLILTLILDGTVEHKGDSQDWLSLVR